jgi:hypothetical protein
MFRTVSLRGGVGHVSLKILFSAVEKFAAVIALVDYVGVKLGSSLMLLFRVIQGLHCSMPENRMLFFPVPSHLYSLQLSLRSNT